MALLKNAFLGLFLVFHTVTWGAWGAMEVNMEDRVEVKWKETAQITCMFESADGLGGVTIQWFYFSPTLNKTERIYYQDSFMQNVDRDTPFSDRISVNGTGATRGLVLTIRNVRLEDDSLDFICMVMGLTDGTDKGRTQLKVFETPNLPSIERVHNGIPVTKDTPSKIGSCEAKNGFPRPNITWYRDNTPLQNIDNEVTMLSLVTSEASGLFSVKSDLSMLVTKEDKDAWFYCEVTYLVPGGTRMTESTRINVTVFFPTTSISVWVESPKGDIKEGDTVELQCRGDGNPQPSLSFYHGDEEKTPDANGVLVLKSASRADGGVYKCESWDFDAADPVQTIGNTTLMVNYLDPAVVEPGVRTLSLGEGMSATCNALCSLHTKTAWFKNGQQVHKGNTLTLKNAMFDTAGTYVCVVTVPSIEGMETSGTLRVFVQGPPEITEPQNTPIEESLEKTVNLSCHARGYPVPSISWSSSDAQVLKSVSQKTTEDAIHSVVSVKVTSDLTAFCNASNDHGSEAVSFSIKAIKHTTKPASTTTTATTTSTSTATVKTPTVSVKTPTVSPKKVKKEGSGVIIAVIIICILLLAILGSVLYFLYKKGKICGRSGKQDLTKEKNNKDNIVVEMKGDNTEEAVLLGVNGDKKLPSDQSDAYLDVKK